MGNIDTGHFFCLTGKLLIEAVDSMLACAGGEGKFHERSITSVDGKVSCGSARKESVDGEVKALQTRNVYSGDYGICLGQKFIEEKTNEIPAAQEVLCLVRDSYKISMKRIRYDLSLDFEGGIEKMLFLLTSSRKSPLLSR